MDEFFEDWKDRYIKGSCTLDHLNRLIAINKLTEEQLRMILLEERKAKKINLMYNKK